MSCKNPTYKDLKLFKAKSTQSQNKNISWVKNISQIYANKGLTSLICKEPLQINRKSTNNFLKCRHKGHKQVICKSMKYQTPIMNESCSTLLILK